MAKEKNPTWAAILSLFIAGLGQIYVGKYWRGAFFLALELATSAVLAYDEVLGFSLNLLVSLCASFDAYKIASKTRGEKVEKEEEIKVTFTRNYSRAGVM